MKRALTDEFLRDVADKYEQAVELRGRPNVAVAEALGAPIATVQRWVYLARQRGIMAPVPGRGYTGGLTPCPTCAGRGRVAQS